MSTIDLSGDIEKHERAPSIERIERALCYFKDDDYRQYLGVWHSRCAVTNGCFDLLHVGHLRLLKKFHDICLSRRLHPIVAINSHESIERLKGPGRPVNLTQDRIEFIHSLRWPMSVVVFAEDDPQQLMDSLHPEIVVKGADYTSDAVIKWSKSEVILVPIVPGLSSTRLIEKSR